MYDFSRCKLCTEKSGVPTYKLKDSTVYACDSCGFHYINHLDTMPSESPDEADSPLTQKAWDFIEGKLIPNGKQLRKNLRIVQEFSRLSEAQCLDIGAGAGLFSSLLSEEGASVYGIEPQRVFREFAQKKFAIALNAETIDDAFWQKGFADFFDVVTLWDVLEHVNFPTETLKEAYRVIRPGGRLFLDTPCRDSLVYKISEWSYRLSKGTNPLLLGSLYSPKPFRHKQIFSLDQLVQLVESIGYTVVRANYSPLKPQNKIVLVCQKPDGAHNE